MSSASRSIRSGIVSTSPPFPLSNRAREHRALLRHSWILIPIQATDTQSWNRTRRATESGRPTAIGQLRHFACY